MLKHQQTCPSFFPVRWLCASDHWTPSRTVCHHTSVLCAEAASDCTMPATEGNYLEYLEQRDDPTSAEKEKKTKRLSPSAEPGHTPAV